MSGARPRSHSTTLASGAYFFHELPRELELLLAALEQVRLVQQHDVRDAELRAPRVRAVEVKPGGSVRGGFRVHDAHHGVQSDPGHLTELLVEGRHRLGGVHEAGGLYEEVVDVGDAFAVIGGFVEHAPHLRLELAAQGAAEASVGELHDAAHVLTGAAAGHDAVVVPRHELGVDVELGEVVDDAGDAQVLAVREHVTHHRGLAAAQPAGDEGGGQTAALGGCERGAELVVTEEVHGVLIAPRWAGGRGFVRIGARARTLHPRLHRSPAPPRHRARTALRRGANIPADTGRYIRGPYQAAEHVVPSPSERLPREQRSVNESRRSGGVAWTDREKLYE